MEYIIMSERPSLRAPVLIGAFAGWNDAAGVASATVQFLTQSWSAAKFASVDPEEFYVFTRVRPHVVLDAGSYRRIEWPANDFFYHIDPTAPHDYIIFSGIEPQLKWKSFSRMFIDFAQEFGVTAFVTLGGLLGDVAHTLPSHLTGTASDPELQAKLKGITITGSRYQGPTGIVGVLNTACRERGIATAAIWGSVPHYLGNVGNNPRVTRDMLRALDGMFDFKLNLRNFSREIAEFDARVAEAVARNAELSAYVRQLETRDRGESSAVAEEPEAPAEGIPSTESILKELEDFLKRRREEKPQDEI